MGKSLPLKAAGLKYALKSSSWPLPHCRGGVARSTDPAPKGGRSTCKFWGPEVSSEPRPHEEGAGPFSLTLLWWVAWSNISGGGPTPPKGTFRDVPHGSLSTVICLRTPWAISLVHYSPWEAPLWPSFGLLSNRAATRGYKSRAWWLRRPRTDLFRHVNNAAPDSDVVTKKWILGSPSN
jgi:hypothetical protein